MDFFGFGLLRKWKDKSSKYLGWFYVKVFNILCQGKFPVFGRIGPSGLLPIINNFGNLRSGFGPGNKELFFESLYLRTRLMVKCGSRGKAKRRSSLLTKREK